MKKTDAQLVPLVKPFIQMHDVQAPDDYLLCVISLVKERCHLLTDFWLQGHFFFAPPPTTDTEAIKGKWNEQKQAFFTNWANQLDTVTHWTAAMLEDNFNQLATDAGLKKGELMLPLRIMLVGGKYGPGVFDIAEMIGKEEVGKRVNSVLAQL